MTALPNGEWQNPTCGACHGDTRCEEPGFYDCEDCLLTFVDENGELRAQFTDEDDKPCGQACTNGWHGDHQIRRGEGYRCGTCILPGSHTGATQPDSVMHYTDCEPIKLEVAS